MSLFYRFHSNLSSRQLKNRIEKSMSRYSPAPNTEKDRLFFRMCGPFLKFVCFPETGPAKYGIQFQGFLIPTKNGSVIWGGFGPRISILALVLVLAAVVLRNTEHIFIFLSAAVAAYFIIYLVSSSIGKRTQSDFLRFMKNFLLDQ